MILAILLMASVPIVYMVGCMIDRIVMGDYEMNIDENE